ncbi:receptor-type tyrosine-protein phosphatase alpha-like [Watersipora subatra]|uniref:receptor-type tyrosine-protein phosphatase alpha-like n=1 Tax=Watersipora subatra TaxID=2589382 RepID=UPI00355C224A
MTCMRETSSRSLFTLLICSPYIVYILSFASLSKKFTKIVARNPSTSEAKSKSYGASDDPYTNLSDESMWKIPVGDLEEFITNQSHSIDIQFEMLEALPKPVMDVALLEKNKGKSRFKGLYPADSHRVKLKPDHAAGKMSSDYINASYIPGYKKETTYIAAQGPTETTVDDFWLMIWQQKIRVIVMVTGAIEHKKKKCVQYWPDNPGDVMTFRDIKVSQTSPEVWADFTFRTFQVTKDGQTRSIKHFNYLTWPDHGVPIDICPYVTFFSKIRAFTTRHKDTLRLVHCSAGVGRTGTYIAMDTLIRQVTAEKSVNAFSFVKKMRARRPCMIQKVEQYHFLYKAMVEFLVTSHFVCPAAGLETKLANRKPGHDVIAKEFLHLQKKVELAKFDWSVGKTLENREKNRFSELLPASHSSLYSGDRGDMYINAILVDAYRERNHWIATQLPLSNTVTDLWKMVLDQNVNVIAQLEGAQVSFYPRNDGESGVAEPYTISRIDTEQSGQLTEISLRVEHENMEAASVKIIVATEWDTDIPSFETILQLQGALEKKQQQTGNNRLCIMCNNGATRCGTFITSYNAIEKLKAEQEADVYNPVVMAKHRRPQFIASFTQYEFIYQVLSAYAESFSDYANFR